MVNNRLGRRRPRGPEGILPRGVIVMWNESINNIPFEWLLCDGTNGTLDLSDRFVLGTINDTEIVDTGGSNSIVLTKPQ